MENLTEILEQELEEAFEVKNMKSLHRYVVLLAENVVKKSIFEQHVQDSKSDTVLLAETMKKGFDTLEKRFEAVDKRFEDLVNYMDKRFEAVDKRFEDMNSRFEDVNKRFEDVNNRFEDVNKRFSMMFSFMSIGFSIIILITVLFKFIQ